MAHSIIPKPSERLPKIGNILLHPKYGLVFVTGTSFQPLVAFKEDLPTVASLLSPQKTPVLSTQVQFVPLHIGLFAVGKPENIHSKTYIETDFLPVPDSRFFYRLFNQKTTDPDKTLKRLCGSNIPVEVRCLSNMLKDLLPLAQEGSSEDYEHALEKIAMLWCFSSSPEYGRSLQCTKNPAYSTTVIFRFSGDIGEAQAKVKGFKETIRKIYPHRSDVALSCASEAPLG